MYIVCSVYSILSTKKCSMKLVQSRYKTNEDYVTIYIHFMMYVKYI